METCRKCVLRHDFECCYLPPTPMILQKQNKIKFVRPLVKRVKKVKVWDPETKAYVIEEKITFIKACSLYKERGVDNETETI